MNALTGKPSTDFLCFVYLILITIVVGAHDADDRKPIGHVANLPKLVNFESTGRLAAGTVKINRHTATARRRPGSGHVRREFSIVSCESKAVGIGVANCNVAGHLLVQVMSRHSISQPAPVAFIPSR
jgi:hypothetical protein